MASFEGKPFTDNHPIEDVTPDNFMIYGKGTVTNVRRGTGNEDNLLLADIIIYNKKQIDEVESKQKREISCGYECDYIPYEDGYMQKNIVGNHVALVDAGRAGSKVAIKDKKTQKGSKKMSEENRAFKIPRRAKSASDYLKAVGLKVVAKDAEPEEILDAVEELIEEGKGDNVVEETKEEVNEKIQEEPQSDERKMIDAEEFRTAIKEIKDAISELVLANKSPEETGIESLDELVEELTGDEEEEEAEVIEAEEETTDEELEEESTNVNDSAIELIRVLKPIIAAVPDPKQRKKMSDGLSKVVKKQLKGKKKTEKPNVYGDMVNKRSKYKDSKRIADEDVGMLIAKKYNPHYKEDK